MQIKNKVGIFTYLTMSPPHPRIVMEAELLKKNNYEVEIISAKTKKSDASYFNKILYYLSFTYFRWDLVSQYKKRISDFDAVIIYDLSLLPLLKYAAKEQKKVVYEVIDNNVYLGFYELQKRIKAFVLLKPFITILFQQVEKRYAQKYADKIVVNSNSLAKEFPKEKTLINFYSSPFEGVALEKTSNNKTALIYLGIFSPEKGANEMIGLSKKYSLPFYVFGEIRNVAAEKIKSTNLIHTPRVGMQELKNRIKEIAKENNLVGMSFIKPIHKSYAMQEANKDMDYLALGIPFIGNYRGVTRSKIEAGCGVFFDEEKNIQKLFTDLEFYNSLSQKAMKYYAENYSKDKFERILMEAIA